MGCEPWAFIGFLVSVLAGIALVIFLAHVCYWAYQARGHRGCGHKHSVVYWDLADLRVQLTSLEDRVGRATPGIIDFGTKKTLYQMVERLDSRLYTLEQSKKRK